MPTVTVRGVAFKHSLSPEGLAKATEHICSSHAVTKLWVKKLRSAKGSSDESGQAHARDWLLHSPEAVLTASVAANRKLKPTKRQSLEGCLEVPDLLDFSQPFAELVPVRAKPKKPVTWGSPVAYRMLHDHRLLHRTAQDLIMRVLGPYFVPRPFQFTHLGTQAAIARAKALIKAGYVYAARLDIVDFYPSFSAEALINAARRSG